MAMTLHTSLGDIKLELFCDLVPRTCEVRVCGCVSVQCACKRMPPRPSSAIAPHLAWPSPHRLTRT